MGFGQLWLAVAEKQPLLEGSERLAGCYLLVIVQLPADDIKDYENCPLPLELMGNTMGIMGGSAGFIACGHLQIGCKMQR